ncbi:N-terminal kinase-like protein isoform X2 [Patagioenas fasciata]
MWRLGCLLWEIFNGPLPRAAALRDPRQVPEGLVAPMCELVAAEPSLRPGPEQLLQRLQRPGAFMSCALVRTALFITHIQLRDPGERREFLQALPQLLDSLPGPFLRHKLLPRLLEALDMGSADATALRPLLKVAKLLDPPEYQERVVPVLVRLFASPDRALRMQLLQQLEDYVEFLPTPTVDAQIFPHVARGFLDTNPAIREQTVKSAVLLAPRLGEGLRGGQLLRLLLRVQTSDALGPLRCNASLSLGRIAPLLPPQARRVCLSALARAARDPFPPSRAAAVVAVASARGAFGPAQLAGGALPPLCPLTCDPHPGVREQAFRVIRSILDELEAAAEKGAPPAEAAPGGAAGGAGGGLGAAVSWAVTGVTALTARIMGGEGGTPPDRPPRGPPQGTPQGTPEGAPEGAPAPPQEPPGQRPLEDPDGWDDEWGSLEDVELPPSPSPPRRPAGRGGRPSPTPPTRPLPPSAPPPASGGGAEEEEGDGGWGVGGEWGSEDAWEEPAGNRGPPPCSGQRQQQRRRDLEPKRRGGPRGPPKAGPQKLGTRKLD